jgi:hypothetical protein
MDQRIKAGERDAGSPALATSAASRWGDDAPKVKPMKTVPSQISSLFERHTSLHGFSVRGRNDVPDSCPRNDEDEDLFVGDVGVSPAVSAAQYREIFEAVVAALAEVLSEEPEAADELRGRTFARTLH